MENLIFSINVVAPTFLIALLGYFLKNKGILSESFFKQLDRYVFTVALPFLMVKDVANADIFEMFSFKFAAFCVVCLTLMFVGFWLVCYPFFENKNFVGAFVQSSARGSVAIFGASIAINIYGTAGVTPLMMAFAVPLYNIYSVILLSLKSDSGGKLFTKKTLKSMLLSIVKNPLIIGIAIGICFSLLKIKLPFMFEKTIANIASTGTPLALLSLGATINFSGITKSLKPALAACFFKLVVFSTIAVPIAIAMGFRQGHLIAILIMTASPTSVTAYIMAKNMDNDYVFSSSAVMLSTVLSIFTMTFWLTILSAMNFI